MNVLMFVLGMLFGAAAVLGWKAGVGLFLRVDFWLRKRRKNNCGFQDGCTNDAPFEATAEAYTEDGEKVGIVRKFKICEPHLKELTFTAMKSKDMSGKAEFTTKTGKPGALSWDNRDVEQLDEPDAFDRLFRPNDKPDMNILKPEPLDPLTAAIEDAYKKGKKT